MEELVEERKVIKRVVEERGYQAFTYEDHAGARPYNHETTFLEELKGSDLYVGIFWNKYGQYQLLANFILQKHMVFPVWFSKRLVKQGNEKKNFRNF